MSMSAVDRIEELRTEGTAAIAAAADSAALEELRVHYLGRKSELTSILRGIADLPAEERGPVGAGRQQRAEGARGSARVSARGPRVRRAR